MEIFSVAVLRLRDQISYDVATAFSRVSEAADELGQSSVVLKVELVPSIGNEIHLRLGRCTAVQTALAIP